MHFAHWLFLSYIPPLRQERGPERHLKMSAVFFIYNLFAHSLAHPCFLLIFIIHSILYCTFYLIAHLTHFILLFVPFFILTYIYIYILLCYVSLLMLFLLYFLFYYYNFFFCTFHWADLSWPTFHCWLYPVWLCMWQIIKNQPTNLIYIYLTPEM